jgi:poly(A) polymerase
MTQEEKILGIVKKTIQGTEWDNRIYLVGGAVRDQIMGSPVDDLDFVVEGNISSGLDFAIWLCKKWKVFKEGSNPVIFPNYGTASMYYNDVKLEFVAPRKEKYKEGSRNPVVSDGVLMDDATRRDLTINSLMRNVSTNEILDLTGKGLSDIKNGIIRTPSDPDITFNDDPLRMIRLVRFSVKYNFKVDENAMNSIIKNAKLITTITSERVRDELNKILMTNNPSKGVELLKDTGLLKYILEEFNETIGMTQNAHHTEDVFQHSMSVLSNTPGDLKTRLIALFHDIGKVLTRTVTPEGAVHFYGHEEASERMVRNIMARLKYPNELIDAVAMGVHEHMSLKPGKDDASQLSDKTLRKFAARVGDNLEYILDVIHADNISHSDESVMRNQIGIVRQRLEQLNSQVNTTTGKMPINGNDVKQILNVKESPLIGRILNAVKEAWFENPNITYDEAAEIVKNFQLNNQINEIKRIMKSVIK